jgi:hypothetical protein
VRLRLLHVHGLVEESDGSASCRATVAIDGAEREVSVCLAPHVYQDIAAVVMRQESQRSYVREEQRQERERRYRREERYA